MTKIKRLPLQKAQWHRHEGKVIKAPSGAPFLLNDRAQLIHRPIQVTLHYTLSSPHFSVHCYCRASFSSAKDLHLIEDVPDDRMVCLPCEQRAVLMGLPSTEEILGRHVHIGRLKAVRVCCNEEGES